MVSLTRYIDNAPSSTPCVDHNLGIGGDLHWQLHDDIVDV